MKTITLDDLMNAMAAELEECRRDVERVSAALEDLTQKAYKDLDGGRKLRRGDVDRACAVLKGKK